MVMKSVQSASRAVAACSASVAAINVTSFESNREMEASAVPRRFLFIEVGFDVLSGLEEAVPRGFGEDFQG